MADSQSAELTALYNSLFIDTCCTLAAAAFFFYECAITFGSEVEYFWKKKPTWACVLYLSSKYISMINFVLDLATYASISSDASCTALQKAASTVQVLQFLPWAAFSALRARALSNSWVLSTTVFGLSIVPLGANFAQYYAFGFAGVIDPVFGCSVNFEISNETIARLVTISRTSLITADLCLIVTTLVALPRENILRRPSGSLRPLASILLRDGTIYFMIMLILNALHLALTLASIFGDGLESYISLFTEPLTAMLVCRFLLHLQRAKSRTMRIESDHPLHFGVDSTDGLPSFVAGMACARIVPKLSENADIARSYMLEAAGGKM